MGYYTRYSLEVINDSDSPNYNAEYDRDVMQAGESDEDFVSEYVGSSWIFEDTCKWYDHDDNMRDISKNYPGVLFILSGEGEESGDIWKAYYRDGKCQFTKAELSFEKFDPEKLS